MTLNKKRSGDENIGKLIILSVTIIIAVWFAWLITYFYQVSKEKEIYLSVLLDVKSTPENVNELDWFEWCTYWISFNAITWLYEIQWCTSYKSDIKWITYDSITETAWTYDLKYKQK